MSRVWRTALVTGSTGFMGRHLVRRLMDQGMAVTRLQRRHTTTTPPSEVVVVTEFSPALLAQALNGRTFDVVFHLAAYGVAPQDRDPQRMQTVNVEATQTLARLAAGWPARAVILAGSGSEYDFSGVTRPVTEDHPLQTRSAYGVSKTAASRAACAAAADSQMSVVTARVFNVYGPGEGPHRLLPSLVKGMAGTDRIALSAGTQLRDFLHVGDVVEALCQLADAGAEAAMPLKCAVNVASGHAVSVRQFCETTADAMPIARERLDFGALPLRPDDTLYFAGDPSLLKSLTGWQPSHTLSSGLTDALTKMK